MKEYKFAKFTPYYSESAHPKAEKFITEMQSKYKTFNVESLSMSNVRHYDQEITVCYTVENWEEEIVKLKAQLGHEKRLMNNNHFIKHRTRELVGEDIFFKIYNFTTQEFDEFLSKMDFMENANEKVSD